MIHKTFYDFLCDELRRGGIWQWAEDRPYREAIEKAEITMAHVRAWERYQEYAKKSESQLSGNSG